MIQLCKPSSQWVVCLLAFAPISVMSQIDSLPPAAPVYSFVDYDENRFYHTDSNAIFDHYYGLFDRMMRYRSGQLNIVHFGGSHIQADIWSNYLRDRLHQIDTTVTGSRGIVFPYKAAGTNRPYSYSVQSTGEWEGFRSSYSKHQSHWGVLGITASTQSDAASMKFTFHESPYPVRFNSVLLMTNADECDYEVTVRTPGELRGMSKIVTPEGYYRYEFFTDLDSIEFVFQRDSGSDDTLEFYGLILENNEPGVAYHSIGVNGSSFGSFQRCEMFLDQLAYLKPDLVIVSIGTNDTSEPDFDPEVYRANYDLFLSQLRAINPMCAFVLTVPNDSYIRKKYHNDNLDAAEAVILDLADKYDAAVWNMYRIMGGPKSAIAWRDKGMLKPDLVHFTKEGYLLKGDLFYNAFRADYLRWFNGRQPIWND